VYIRIQDELPAQCPLFGKLRIQNMFNFVRDYKVTSHFSDNKLLKNLYYVWVNLVLLVQYQSMSSDPGRITFVSLPLRAFVTYWLKDMNDSAPH